MFLVQISFERLIDFVFDVDKIKILIKKQLVNDNMVLPFIGWLVVIIFIAIVVKEIKEELAKGKVDWIKLGMLVLFAWILYKMQFG